MAEDGDENESHVHVMIEALQRELACVKNGLAAITRKLEQDLQSYSPDSSAGGHESSIESVSSITLQKKLTAPITTPPKPAPSHSNRGYYIDVLDTVERERCELKKRCFLLMQKHIENQLEKLRETSRRFEQKLHLRQEKAKLERLKRKPIRYRSDGSEDWSFLHNVYQSPFYQVAEKTHKHRKAGSTTTITATIEAAQQVHSAEGSENEDDEDIYGCTDSWAITALPYENADQARTDQVNSRASAPRLTPPSTVPLKFPELKSISDILNEGNPATQERKIEDVHLSKLKQLSGLRRARHLMYQQAKCNQIAMMKLLQGRPWSEFDAPTVSFPPVASSLSVPASSFQQSAPQMHCTVECSSSTKNIEASPSLPSLPSPTPSLKEQHHVQPQQQDPCSFHTEVPQISKPIPLTMDSIVNTAVSVKECKRKSALWTNYFS